MSRWWSCSRKKTLESTPTDAAANVLIGRFLCFVKGDWESGLARLALGGDESLRATAEKDAAVPGEARPKLRAVREHGLAPAVEFIPLWVVVGTALALGVGTCVGYKRIVTTVAEKIGKQHLTYAQGAAAETVAACTILITAVTGLPVSTTHVLNSGVAGTMAANRSGLQWKTVAKIFTAWLFTLPSCILLAALLFWIGRLIVG